MDGGHGGGGVAAGDAVDGGDFGVHFADDSGEAELGEADAGGVAVGGFS